MSTYPPAPQWPYPPPGLPGAPPPAARQPPRYSRLSALVLSFFSASLYRDVARNWRGIGLLYLFLLMALTWLPPIIRGHVSLRRFVRDESPKIIDQVPTLTIKNGVVSIAEPEPYFIRDPETGKALVYIDTSGAFDDAKAAKDAVVLVSRSTLEVRQPNKTEVHDLSKVENFSMDKRSVAHWLDIGASWFGPVAYISSVIWSLLYGLVRLLVYALVGLIFVSAFNARLDFAALMRLAAVAMTPAMAIDTLAWTFNFGTMPCCGWQFLMAIVALIYLGFAVKANADATSPPPTGVYGGYGFTQAPPQYPPPPYQGPPTPPQ
jgi:hypothetical protein